MNLLPLSLFIFSLLAGKGNIEDQMSDEKGDVISGYENLQVEEMQHKVESIESKEV